MYPLNTLLQRARFGLDWLAHGNPDARRSVEVRLLEFLGDQPASATSAAFRLHIAPGVVLSTLHYLREEGRVRATTEQPALVKRFPRLKSRLVVYEIVS